MATQAKPSSSKIQPRDGSSSLSSKVKIDPLIKDKKKITSSNKQIMSDNNKPRSSVSTLTAKSEANLKIHVKSAQTSTSVAVKGKTKREKKVFSLPGQKFDVPEEREPLRIFYESLSKQRPGNEMAEFWLMEHGMLSPAKAKKAFERKQRKAKQIRTGTPIKQAPALSKKPESSRGTSVSKNNGLDARKKIKVDDENDDDEFILSHKRRKV